MKQIRIYLSTFSRQNLLTSSLFTSVDVFIFFISTNIDILFINKCSIDDVDS